jgi:DNA polymerase-3 subunit gamma/tau
MSKALYRKYRSKKLSEIVGQQHVTAVLSRALEQGKVAHAYLLTGPRGIGKTSIARILAHEINKLPYTDESSHLDIIEIDAASNNGVDDVRDLREKVQLAPVSAHKKVYIIDEVHMLSKPAFNALLKTLEEPPEHIVFILATTNIEKLPDTIISRTQRFTLRSIATEDATNHLRTIADNEKILIEDTALTTIAQRGNGSFRDSISLLDQLSTLLPEGETITQELIEQTLGLAPQTVITDLMEAIKTQDVTKTIAILSANEKNGIDTVTIIDQLIQAVKHEVIKSPSLLPVLDGLLDAKASIKPDIKLFTVLVSASLPKSKQAAPVPLLAHTPTISAPVQKLKKETPKVEIEEATIMKPEPVEETIDIPMPKTIATAAYPDNFDWNKLIDYARTNHVAFHSILSKCSHEVKDGTLIIYTMRKFNKTKIDDAKYRPLLSECLIQTGAGDMLVETIPTPPPPKDSQAAAVAAIMGGGEEVAVDA